MASDFVNIDDVVKQHQTWFRIKVVENDSETRAVQTNVAALMLLHSCCLTVSLLRMS